MNSCHCCIWKRFLLRTNELPSCSHNPLHSLLFVQISDAAVAKTRLCKDLISEFLTLQGCSDNHWRHSWFWMSITTQFCGGHSCHTTYSVGVLQHPTTAGVINFPTEEHPVMGHLTGGEQFAPGVTIRPFWHNVPRRNYPFVNHL